MTLKQRLAWAFAMSFVFVFVCGVPWVTLMEHYDLQTVLPYALFLSIVMFLLSVVLLGIAFPKPPWG